MVHNGSSRGTWTLPTDPHQEFRELCALSTTGELTAEEWSRLIEHLADCHRCRQEKEKYERVARQMIPALAAEAHSNTGDNFEDEPGATSWSIDKAEARLMEALNDEPPPSRIIPIKGPRASKWHYMRRYTIAALIVLGCGAGGYQLGILRGSGRESSRAPSGLLPQRAATNPVQPPQMPVSPTSSGPSSQVQTAKLQDDLRQSQLESEKVKKQLRSLDAELAQRNADIDRLGDDREILKKQLVQAQENAQDLESRMAAISSQTAKGTVQSLALRAQIEDLNAAAESKDRQIAKQQDLLQRDSDIRNLISARNLYIAEIYDVDKNDATQKPFGRVFYTKDKSLIFYGYDLDEQKGIQKDASFQAWGHRGSDPKGDVNLGLLYQDDANQKRWVLRFNDAKTISELDSVFITVEPQGGSAKPSSKPLLFTYLHIDPNHP
jgi:hypothetical protein